MKVSSKQIVADPDRPLIFVAGLARSGTTLFQTIFARHPGVFSFPETHFFEAVGYLRLFDAPLTRESLDQLGADILLRGGLDEDEWSELRACFLATKSKESDIKTLFLMLVQQFQSRLGRESTNVAVEKTPGHVFQLERLLPLFPSAKVFLLRRNPRDYADSISKYTWSPGTVRQIGALWSETINRIDNFSRLERERVMVVDYEDLTSSPEKVMADCFNHAGLEFDKSFLVGLGSTSATLVRTPEVAWKTRNLAHNSVVKASKVVDLSLRQRVRLLLALSPAALAKYRLRHLRF